MSRALSFICIVFSYIIAQDSTMRVTLFVPYKEEQWVSSLVFTDRLFSALQKLGIDVHIVSPGEHVLKPLLRFSKLRFLFRYFVYPVLAFFYQGEINHILDSSYAHASLFLPPQTTVITCHDVIPLKLFRERVPSQKERAKLFFYRLSMHFLNRSQHIVAVSESTKRDLVELLGIPEEKIRVIYQGVGEEFRPIRNIRELVRIRKKYRLPHHFILHVGHNYYYKNVELLLRLLHDLHKHKQTSDIHLVKVGPPFMPEQQRLIERLTIADTITRLPYVPTKDLVGVYNLAMLLVHPSSFEGFGLTVLEAMASGLPVVATDIPPFRELYGGAAALVPRKRIGRFLATVPQLLSEKNRLAKLRRRGLALSRRFSWMSAAKSYRAVYQKVVQSSVGSPARFFTEQRLFLRGGMYALLFGALAKLFGFLWKLLAARLGSFSFGLFSIAWSYVEILSSLAVLGLPVGVIRYVSYSVKKGQSSKSLGVLRLSLFIVVSVGLFLVILSFPLRNWFFGRIFHRPEIIPVFTILLFSIPLLATSEILLAAVNAGGYVKRFFLAKQVVPSLVRLVTLLLLLSFAVRDARSIAWSLLFFAIALFLASLVSAVRVFPSLLSVGLPAIDRGFLSFSFPVSIAHIIQSFSGSIDIILLSIFLPTSSVGIYASSYIFLPLIRLLPESFLEFLSSAFARAVAHHPQAFPFLTWAMKLLFLVTLPFLVFVVLARKILVSFFLPQDFSLSSAILPLLAIAFFLRWVVVLPFRKAIDTFGRTDITLRLTILEVFLQVSAGILLIRSFGILGASLMMLLVFLSSAFLALGVVWGFATRRIPMNLPKI